MHELRTRGSPFLSAGFTISISAKIGVRPQPLKTIIVISTCIRGRYADDERDTQTDVSRLVLRPVSSRSLLPVFRATHCVQFIFAARTQTWLRPPGKSPTSYVRLIAVVRLEARAAPRRLPERRGCVSRGVRASMPIVIVGTLLAEDADILRNRISREKDDRSFLSSFLSICEIV